MTSLDLGTMSNRKPGWLRKTRSLGTTGSLRSSSLVAFTAPSSAVSAVTTPSDSHSRPIESQHQDHEDPDDQHARQQGRCVEGAVRSACSGLGKFEASSTIVTSHAHSTVSARVPTIVTMRDREGGRSGVSSVASEPVPASQI